MSLPFFNKQFLLDMVDREQRKYQDEYRSVKILDPKKNKAKIKRIYTGKFYLLEGGKKAQVAYKLTFGLLYPIICALFVKAALLSGSENATYLWWLQLPAIVCLTVGIYFTFDTLMMPRYLQTEEYGSVTDKAAVLFGVLVLALLVSAIAELVFICKGKAFGNSGYVWALCLTLADAVGAALLFLKIKRQKWLTVDNDNNGNPVERAELQKRKGEEV